MIAQPFPERRNNRARRFDFERLVLGRWCSRGPGLGCGSGCAAARRLRRSWGYESRRLGSFSFFFPRSRRLKNFRRGNAFHGRGAFIESPMTMVRRWRDRRAMWFGLPRRRAVLRALNRRGRRWPSWLPAGRCRREGPFCCTVAARRRHETSGVERRLAQPAGGSSRRCRSHRDTRQFRSFGLRWKGLALAPGRRGVTTLAWGNPALGAIGGSWDARPPGIRTVHNVPFPATGTDRNYLYRKFTGK